VRLLLDQNLSPYLVDALRDLYPDSTHVRDVNLASADDEVVWNFAAQQRLSIVSKDSDFRQRSFVRGHPPKVVWIARGNCSTEEIASLLRDRHADLLAFEQDDTAPFSCSGSPRSGGRSPVSPRHATPLETSGRHPHHRADAQGAEASSRAASRVSSARTG
jgi:predicted nuclease of predicted toxin-antitoxin system